MPLHIPGLVHDWSPLTRHPQSLSVVNVSSVVPLRPTCRLLPELSAVAPEAATTLFSRSKKKRKKKKRSDEGDYPWESEFHAVITLLWRYCLVAESCPTLLPCHELYSPPGFTVHGILQARILEWVAISSSRGSSQPRDGTRITTEPSGKPGTSAIHYQRCEELTHLKGPWCWERLKTGGEGDDRGWDGWMASWTQWTWVWTNSRSWR